MRYSGATVSSVLRRQLTLPVLAVLLCWSCSQQSVQASCGDYVMIGDHHPSHTSMPGTPTGHHTCHGPGCRQLPVLPLPAEKPAIEDESTWGLPEVISMDAAAPLAAHWLRDASLAHARLCPLGIFRPPRSAA